MLENRQSARRRKGEDGEGAFRRRAGVNGRADAPEGLTRRVIRCAIWSTSGTHRRANKMRTASYSSNLIFIYPVPFAKAGWNSLAEWAAWETGRNRTSLAMEKQRTSLQSGMTDAKMTASKKATNKASWRIFHAFENMLVQGSITRCLFGIYITLYVI